MFKEPLYILFDGNCGLCRKMAMRVKSWDTFNSMLCLNMMDAELLKKHHLDFLDPVSMAKDIHILEGKTIFLGYDGYRKIAQRVIWLWPIWPLLYMWPITAIGRKIYRDIADKRNCVVKR